MCDLNKNSNFNQINHKSKSFNSFIINNNTITIVGWLLLQMVTNPPVTKWQHSDSGGPGRPRTQEKKAHEKLTSKIHSSVLSTSTY